MLIENVSFGVDETDQPIRQIAQVQCIPYKWKNWLFYWFTGIHIYIIYTFVTLVTGFYYSWTTVRPQANTIKTKQLKHAGDFHLKATHTTLGCWYTNTKILFTTNSFCVYFSSKTFKTYICLNMLKTSKTIKNKLLFIL